MQLELKVSPTSYKRTQVKSKDTIILSWDSSLGNVTVFAALDSHAISEAYTYISRNVDGRKGKEGKGKGR